ncbi:hypothetical protein [Granulibacter bethesdensis]|uniref:hypothetical protein n=1 Tax=Granulibacter bethesdensis TaxID=364410 RepID=UPI00093436DB|nr:hypothetical protein [Granulibacter bethesdensis]
MRHFISDMRFFMDRIHLPQAIILAIVAVCAAISIITASLGGPIWIVTLFGVPCPFLFFAVIAMIV